MGIRRKTTSYHFDSANKPNNYILKANKSYLLHNRRSTKKGKPQQRKKITGNILYFFKKNPQKPFKGIII